MLSIKTGMNILVIFVVLNISVYAQETNPVNNATTTTTTPQTVATPQATITTPQAVATPQATITAPQAVATPPTAIIPQTGYSSILSSPAENVSTTGTQMGYSDIMYSSPEAQKKRESFIYLNLTLSADALMIGIPNTDTPNYLSQPFGVNIGFIFSPFVGFEIASNLREAYFFDSFYNPNSSDQLEIKNMGFNIYYLFHVPLYNKKRTAFYIYGGPGLATGFTCITDYDRREVYSDVSFGPAAKVGLRALLSFFTMAVNLEYNYVYHNVGYNKNLSTLNVNFELGLVF